VDAGHFDVAIGVEVCFPAVKNGKA